MAMGKSRPAGDLHEHVRSNWARRRNASLLTWVTAALYAGHIALAIALAPREKLPAVPVLILAPAVPALATALLIYCALCVASGRRLTLTFVVILVLAITATLVLGAGLLAGWVYNPLLKATQCALMAVLWTTAVYVGRMVHFTASGTSGD